MEKEISNDLLIIDSHCHLQFFNKEELDSLLRRCKDNNITYLFTNSTNNLDFEITEKLESNENINILTSYGYHPWYLKSIYSSFLLNTNCIDENNNTENWIIDLEKLIQLKLKNKIPVGMGEIGIDNLFPIKEVPLTFQIEVFLKQLLLSDKYNLFTSIHCVRSWDDLFKTLKDYFIKNQKSRLITNKLILLHSYCGNLQQTKKFLKLLNCWFSISPGCFVERNYEILKFIPLENMILESDSPSMFNSLIFKSDEELTYLKENFVEDEDNKYKNSPESIIFLAKRIAELRNMNYNNFMVQISKNNKIVLECFNKCIN